MRFIVFLEEEEDGDDYMKSQKYIFLQALIITFVVFNIGIFLGYKLESSRIDKIDKWYLESELELLDQRIQSQAFDELGLDCDSVCAGDRRENDQG